MARRRMITPSFWTDDKILELEIGARLLFIGMWNFADDDGIIVNKPKQIKAQIYPADNITHEQITEWLMSIHEQGLILFGNKCTLIKIKGWSIYQKINRPTPSIYTFDLDDSMSNHGSLMPKRSKEKLSKDKLMEVKRSNTVQTEKQFEQFWLLYPRKVQKQRALNAYKKLGSKDMESANTLLNSHIKYWNKADRSSEHIPPAATWINTRSWEDVLPSDEKERVPTAKDLELIEAFKRTKDRMDNEIIDNGYSNGSKNKQKMIYKEDLSSTASDSVPIKEALKSMMDKQKDTNE